MQRAGRRRRSHDPPVKYIRRIPNKIGRSGDASNLVETQVEKCRLREFVSTKVTNCLDLRRSALRWPCLVKSNPGLCSHSCSDRCSGVVFQVQTYLANTFA